MVADILWAYAQIRIWLVGLVVLYHASSIFVPKTFDLVFDYIIVGGGAAGCVLANRLSEDPSIKVLLLEAGGYENLLTDAPILHFNLWGNKYGDWHYKTIPQKNSYLGSKEPGVSQWYQGKYLGGSTTMNAMLYVRGSPLDYNKWKYFGVDGWSYTENLPYFIKSEATQYDHLKSSQFHGSKGPLKVSAPRFRTPLSDAFVSAGGRTGYKSFHDYNSPDPLGFSVPQTTTTRGKRETAASAYLEGIVGHRPNLQVLPLSQVTKININRITKRAESVLFTRFNEWHVVRARKEIILSAGALNTPKLLMLSGIGPKRQLEGFKIPVVLDKPGVGINLQDHLGAGGLIFTINESVSINTNDVRPSNVLRYLVDGEGPITSSLVDGLGFINTKYGPKSRIADVELIFVSGSILSDYGSGLKRTHFLGDPLWHQYLPFVGRDSFSTWPVLLQPKSRGYMKLKSKDPFDDPIFDGNYLSNREDIETLRRGMKFMLKITKEPSLAKYDPQLVKVPIPGCHEDIVNDPNRMDEYLECSMKSYSVNFWHFCGTARMGLSSDPLAVVDSRLNLIGLNGLRIVDASVMPTVTTGHLQAVIYMMAEKAADFIKQDQEILKLINSHDMM